MTGPDFEGKAREAWGEDAPSWVLALARACNETSQSRVARRLGVSASMVSTAIAGKYAGDLDRLAELCRGEFERVTVACPVLGDITPLVCRGWQQKADRLRTGNNQNARMFRACNRCPRYRKEEENDG